MDLYTEKRENIPMIGKLGELSDDDLETIFSKINNRVLDKKECWIWEGYIADKIKKGHQHGTMSFKGKPVMIHRIMYHNFIADVPVYTPTGLIVLHKCSHENNGRCINPWHMKLGTPKENTNDAFRDGTLTLMKSNEENPMSKLSNEKVKEIINLKDTGITQKKVAEMYNVNPSQISRYWNNKTRIQN